MPNFKIEYVPWWNPRPLMKHEEDGFNQVGWVWRQKARLVNNLNYGWIAFVEDQTDSKLKECPCCKKPLEDLNDNNPT